jgi:DNA-binding IclR family transcriptional regulator
MTTSGELLTLTNAVAVIRLVASEGELGVAEIAARLDISKTAAHRVTTTLTGLDVFGKDPRTRRYHLTQSLWDIAVGGMHRTPLFDLAVKHVQRLALEIDASTNLSIPAGTETAFLARVLIEPEGPIFYPIAAHLPTYRNAAGKAMLAFQGRDSFEQVVAAGLEPVTPDTITDPDLLAAHLDEVRTIGYSVNRGETTVGLAGIGVPIFDSEGVPVAAFGMSVPAERFTADFAADTSRAMLAAAREVSHALGFREHWADGLAIV